MSKKKNKQRGLFLAVLSVFGGFSTVSYADDVQSKLSEKVVVSVEENQVESDQGLFCTVDNDCKEVNQFPLFLNYFFGLSSILATVIEDDPKEKK